jgi:hypothetical protein|tara:strand:- start:252 stop:377 length:126 start_codon:yes stop_codon:yes gene_type:complete
MISWISVSILEVLSKNKKAKIKMIDGMKKRIENCRTHNGLD